MFVDEAAVRAMSHHALVSESFRLVIFTIPKVGCTQLIQLMRRIDGSPDWSELPHYKPGRPFLKNLGRDRVDEILGDPTWTKALVLRDPAERLLSAYLDKFLYKGGYASRVFGSRRHGMPFDEFLGCVLDSNTDPEKPTGLHLGTDPHWRPQRLVGSVEAVASQCDSVGDFADIATWIEGVLRKVGAWDFYGASGWGESGDFAVFETNTAPHRTNASQRMAEFFDRATLGAVYQSYEDDISLASSLGLGLVKHGSLLT